MKPTELVIYVRHSPRSTRALW